MTRAFSLVRLCAVLILGGLALLVLAGVWANWSRDRNADGIADGFTVHVLDPTWWQAIRTRSLPAQAAAERALFAPDGALQRARAFFTAQGLDSKPAQPSAATPATGPRPEAPAPLVGSDQQRPTLHLEDDLDEGLELMARGVALATVLAAKPSEQWTLDDLRQWRAARADLHGARRLFRQSLGPYSQRPDRDMQLQGQAEEALRRCEDLLLNQP